MIEGKSDLDIEIENVHVTNIDLNLHSTLRYM